MRKRRTLSEANIRRIVKECFRSVLREDNDDFYAEEDSYGKTGKPGYIKSYEIGYWAVEQAEADAEEMGLSLSDYLKFWWDEVSSEGMEFTWQRKHAGYGYNGSTLLSFDGIVFKDIYGQIMVDEYPPEALN